MLLMFLFIDNTVQMQDQITDAQRNPGVFSEPVPPCLFDQAKYLCLYFVETDSVIVKNIFSLCPDILHQIPISHRGFHHLV